MELFTKKFKMKKLFTTLILLFISFFYFTTDEIYSKKGIRKVKLKLNVINQKKIPVKYAKITYKIFYYNSKIKTNNKFCDEKGNLSISFWYGGTFLIDRIVFEISSRLYTDQKFILIKKNINDDINKNKVQIFMLNSGSEINEVEWNSRRHLLMYLKSKDWKNLSIMLKQYKYKEAEHYVKKKKSANDRRYSYIFMGFVAFDNNDLKRSKLYFNKAESRLWYNLMGIKFFRLKQYEKSVDYLIKGILRRDRADLLFKLGRILENSGKRKIAMTVYRQCLKDYSMIMKSLNFKWTDKLIYKSKILRNKLKRKYKISNRRNKKEEELSIILKKAGEYCEKLKNSALYFFNIVKKKEYMNFSKKLNKAMSEPYLFFENYSPFKKVKFSGLINIYKFDYQLIINSDKSITENKILVSLKLDNKLNREFSDYSIKKAFYGPVNLIGKEWQDAFNYRILKNDVIFNKDAFVLEVKPIISSTINRYFGKVWVDKKNGAILKIEWTPYGIPNRKDIIKYSMILDRFPNLVFVSEFEKERRKLRFPSRSYITESYIDRKGNRYIRIKTEYKYFDYKFFYVDMDIKTKND